MIAGYFQLICTQKVEEFTAPVAGEYKLECWGAQGRGASGHPGSGGYAVGSINLSRLYSIYVCVGGYSNCYNNQIGTIRSYYLGSIGGGGTSITTTNDGELKNFKDKQNEVLLVAGGGSSHGNTSLLISNSYKTIDGAHEMPSPDGGTETGHSGHGACIISWILK